MSYMCFAVCSVNDGEFVPVRRQSFVSLEAAAEIQTLLHEVIAKT